MSKLSDLQEQVRTLDEIKDILGAMKNLALIETTKLSRLRPSQESAAATVRAALNDFEKFYGRPSHSPRSNPGLLCLLFGSERGFCGPFNENLLHFWQQEVLPKYPDVRTLVVGHKLGSKMEGLPRVEKTLAGPNMTEEIAGVMADLAQSLLPYVGWRWLFVQNPRPGVKGIHATFPLERSAPEKAPLSANAPLLYLSANELYPRLLEQHLLSVLRESLHSSFLAESRERLQHMDAALKQIENQSEQLTLRMNSFRQEEVTEELEILMLSVQSEK